MPITVAILLNEVRSNKFRKTVQTAIYLPYFLSWVVLGGVMIDILSPSQGILNQVLNFFGIDSIFFLGSNKWFQPTIIMTDVWKGFGFGTVVYLAAITGIVSACMRPRRWTARTASRNVARDTAGIRDDRCTHVCAFLGKCTERRV